jgi:hypothetical protein
MWTIDYILTCLTLHGLFSSLLLLVFAWRYSLIATTWFAAEDYSMSRWFYWWVVLSSWGWHLVADYLSLGF